MARNVSDLTFVSEGIYSSAQAEREKGKMVRQRIMPVPWREVDLPKRLKVGYWIEDGSFKVSLESLHPQQVCRRDFYLTMLQTSPACARAVRMSVEALEKAGHEVKLFEPPSSESSSGHQSWCERVGLAELKKAVEMFKVGVPLLPIIVLYVVKRCQTLTPSVS
jgi:Asp-tRNA(Asn)/Glu-tRNA(Gln) amidotransferase A subunit family amidase